MRRAAVCVLPVPGPPVRIASRPRAAMAQAIRCQSGGRRDPAAIEAVVPESDGVVVSSGASGPGAACPNRRVIQRRSAGASTESRRLLRARIALATVCS